MSSHPVGSAVTARTELIFGQEIRVFDITAARTDAPSIYIQSGLHPNETTGCSVLHSLLARYESESCPVNLRLVPHVNPLGWRTYIENGSGRVSYPNFVNWNRIFSGDTSALPDRPTIEQGMADLLLRLSSGYDHVVDVHTPECGWPHVYAPGLSGRLNTFDDLPHIIFDEPELFTFADYHAHKSGRPASTTIRRSVTLELPSHRLQSVRDLGYWAQRLHDEIESIRELRVPSSTPPALTGSMIDLNARIDGICYLVAEPGQRCGAGDVIATIVDPQGNRDEIRAAVDVVPLCYRRSAVARAGGWAVRCLSLEPRS